MMTKKPQIYTITDCVKTNPEQKYTVFENEEYISQDAVNEINRTLYKKKSLKNKSWCEKAYIIIVVYCRC